MGTSEPWQSTLEQYAEDIWDSTMTTIDLMLHYATDETTAFALRNLVIASATNLVKAKVSQPIPPNFDALTRRPPCHV